MEEREVQRCGVSVPVPAKLFQSASAAQTELVLTETRVFYRQEGRRKEILLEDLIGVCVIEKPPTNNPFACQIEIHHYPLTRSGLARKPTRKFAVAQIQFDAAATFRDNLYAAIEWKKAICLESHRAVRKAFICANDDSRVNEDEELRPFHFLVFINPVGGPGKAVTEFQQHVQPLFDLAEINYNIIVTERQGHAHDIVMDYDLSQIDGIVIVSGDGVLYEVVNGLMKREDWETAIKTPIGMLPTGSGNALCASYLFESDEEFSLTNAAFQIIRGGVVPMDIATVQKANESSCYMTLLISWGLVADVDIESEKWRSIGETRFLLGAVNCIVRKRVYRGRLYYLPVEEEATPTEPAPSQTQGTDTHSETKQDSEWNQNGTGVGVHVTVENGAVSSDSELVESGRISEQIEPQHKATPLAPTHDNSVETPRLEPHTDSQQHLYPNSYSEAVAEPSQLLLRPQQQQNGELEDAQNGDAHESMEEVREPSGSVKERQSQSAHSHRPPTDLLPQRLSDPVPSNWIMIEGEFISVTVVMVSHMSRGSIGDPNLRMGSGKMTILYTMSSLSRLTMLELFAASEKGKHVEMDSVNVVSARAFRLEPITDPGILTVDGEVMEYAPIQAQVHRHLARGMCRKRRAKTTEQS